MRTSGSSWRSWSRTRASPIENDSGARRPERRAAARTPGRSSRGVGGPRRLRARCGRARGGGLGPRLRPRFDFVGRARLGLGRRTRFGGRARRGRAGLGKTRRTSRASGSRTLRAQSRTRLARRRAVAGEVALEAVGIAERGLVRVETVRALEERAGGPARLGLELRLDAHELSLGRTVLAQALELGVDRGLDADRARRPRRRSRRCGTASRAAATAGTR